MFDPSREQVRETFFAAWRKYRAGEPLVGVETMIDRIENASPLDPVVKTVRKIVNAALGPQPVRDALHGLWLGHPLHPMLTDVPIGAWTAAGVLDLLPGTGHASTTLIATGRRAGPKRAGRASSQ